MEILKALLKEMVGMFVDDGSLAIAILAVAAVSAGIALRFNAESLVAGCLLLGCLGVLSENVIRSARKRGK